MLVSAEGASGAVPAVHRKSRVPVAEAAGGPGPERGSLAAAQGASGVSVCGGSGCLDTFAKQQLCPVASFCDKSLL